MAFEVTDLAHEEDPDFVVDDEENSSEESDWSFDEEPQIGDEVPDYATLEVIFPNQQSRSHGTANKNRGAEASSRATEPRLQAPKVQLANYRTRN